MTWADLAEGVLESFAERAAYAIDEWNDDGLTIFYRPDRAEQNREYSQRYQESLRVDPLKLAHRREMKRLYERERYERLHGRKRNYTPRPNARATRTRDPRAPSHS